MLSQSQGLIDATRFELATSASRTQRSTKLSHASLFYASEILANRTGHVKYESEIIRQLREAGHDIKTEMMSRENEDGTITRYARYYI